MGRLTGYKTISLRGRPGPRCLDRSEAAVVSCGASLASDADAQVAIDRLCTLAS